MPSTAERARNTRDRAKPEPCKKMDTISPTRVIEAIEITRRSPLPAPGQILLRQIETLSDDPRPGVSSAALSIAEIVRFVGTLPDSNFRDLMTTINRLREQAGEKQEPWRKLDELHKRMRVLEDSTKTIHQHARAHLAAEIVTCKNICAQVRSPDARQALSALSDRWNDGKNPEQALLTLGMLQQGFTTFFPEMVRRPGRYVAGERVPDGLFADDLALLARLSRSSGIPIANAQLIKGLKNDFALDMPIRLYSGDYQSAKEAAVQGKSDSVQIQLVIVRTSEDEVQVLYQGRSHAGTLEKSAGILSKGGHIIFGRDLKIERLFGDDRLLTEPIRIQPEVSATIHAASRAALKLSWTSNGRMLIEDLGGKRAWGFSQGASPKQRVTGVYDPGPPPNSDGPDGFTAFFH